MVVVSLLSLLVVVVVTKVNTDGVDTTFCKVDVVSGPAVSERIV